MGFGYIFVGYFFLIFFPLSRVDVLPNLSIIGCVLMFMGISRLMHYCDAKYGFKRAAVSLLALCGVSAAALAFDIAEMCGVIKNADPALNVAYAAASCLFLLLLLRGICKLSRDVGLPSLAKRTVWMMSITVLYSIFEVVSCGCSVVLSLSEYPSDAFIAITANMGLFTSLLAYLSIFLNLALFFACYARICLEGDEDMPYHEDIFDKLAKGKNRNKK